MTKKTEITYDRSSQTSKKEQGVKTPKNKLIRTRKYGKRINSKSNKKVNDAYVKLNKEKK